MKNVKLRYYLRGLGIGTLVTAVVMGTALQGEEKPLTDAQIKERALELGMVDANSLVLSDLQNDSMVKNDLTEETKEPSREEMPSTEEIISTEENVSTEEMPATEDMQPVGGDVPVETEQDANEDASTEAIQPTEDENTTEEVQSPVEEQSPAEDALVADQTDTKSRVNGQMNAEGDTATVEISSGAHSYAVSKVLADLGLVADASAFDNFLCNNGYSKKIHTGRYMIAVGTSEEEIAKIITGNR